MGRSSTIHYIFNAKILLCIKYCYVPPDTTQLLKKTPDLYEQYKGIKLSWQDPVPMGIFMCLLAFNSTFNLILAFNSIHLLLVCTLLDIREDPQWLGNPLGWIRRDHTLWTWPNPLLQATNLTVTRKKIIWEKTSQTFKLTIMSC